MIRVKNIMLTVIMLTILSPISGLAEMGLFFKGQWGMTPKQIIAAYTREHIEEGPVGHSDYKLVYTQIIEGRPATITFLFTSTGVVV